MYKMTTSISSYLIFDTTQHHVYQNREGEEGDFGSDVGISSHEGKMLTVPVSDLGLCDLNFNNRWLRVEKLAEEKDLARFFPS